MYNYSFYEVISGNIGDTLQAIKDYGQQHGWIIDEWESYTQILKMHVPNTECYFRLTPLQDYLDFLYVLAYDSQGTYFMKNNVAVPSQSDMTFSLERSFLFVHTKSIVVFFTGFLQVVDYEENETNYHVSLMLAYGQLEIPNESLYGNYLLGSTFKDTGVDFFYKGDGSSESGANLVQGWYYQGTRNCFNYESSGFKGFDLTYSVDTNSGDMYYSFTADDGRFADFLRFPVQFGRHYLFTLPIYHKYVLNTVTYRHPISTTPFYFCKYQGASDFGKVLTYGTRKFKIMPIGEIERGNTLGIALEVFNV